MVKTVKEASPTISSTTALGEGARILAPSDDMREVLSTTYRELAVQVPLRMDDGKVAHAAELRGYV